MPLRKIIIKNLPQFARTLLDDAFAVVTRPEEPVSRIQTGETPDRTSLIMELAKDLADAGVKKEQQAEVLLAIVKPGNKKILKGIQLQEIPKK